MTRLTPQWISMLATAYVGLSSVIISVSSAPAETPKTIYVQAHEKIQAAIDAAHSGDKIIVQAGTYPEQLNIEKDGLEIIGQDAVIIPPQQLKHNFCTDFVGKDTQVGICIHGAGIQLSAGSPGEHQQVISVKTPVKNVIVSGFSVRDFSANVAVYGGQDVHVLANKLDNAPRYGALTVGSKRTRISDNAVAVDPKKTFFIGICADDPDGVEVSRNTVDGYVNAICLETPAGDVSHNVVTNVCFGTFIDGAHGATVVENHISNSSPYCADITDIPGVIGITLNGVNNAKVENNHISWYTTGGKDKISAGVAIIDDTEMARTSNNNSVQGNFLSNNNVEILINTKGSGNTIKSNTCSEKGDGCA